MASPVPHRTRLQRGTIQTALALGVAKEFLDSRREGAEAMDLAADAVGLGVALVTVRGRAP